MEIDQTISSIYCPKSVEAEELLYHELKHLMKRLSKPNGETIFNVGYLSYCLTISMFNPTLGKMTASLSWTKCMISHRHFQKFLTIDFIFNISNNFLFQRIKLNPKKKTKNCWRQRADTSVRMTWAKRSLLETSSITWATCHIARLQVSITQKRKSFKTYNKWEWGVR